MTAPIPATIRSFGRSQTFLSASSLESAMAARYPDQLWDSSDDDDDDNMDDLLRRRRRSSVLESTPLCTDRSPLVHTDQERSPPASVAPHAVRRASHGDYLSVQTGLGTIEESLPDLRAVPTPQSYEYGAITHDTHDLAFQEDGGIRSLGHRGSSTFKDISIPRGTSTYGQTLFNSTAILLGIGGTCLIIFYGAISCYSAKILAKIILSDRRLRTYSDIGRKAFGSKSNTFISFLFCLELFTVCVVLVTLAADSMHSVVPYYSSNTYKLIGLFILTPTVFIPLRYLSYASILGIFSTLLVIFAVVYDGMSKRDAPGSLWQPEPTQWMVWGKIELGTAFGLFMAGFSGHAVIPSLAKDMAEPRHFDHMINRAFVVATVIYGLIGAAGYLMFGSNVSEEVSLDLLKTPGYNPIINKLAVWMLVISPMTKFSLTMRPLNIALEVLLGLEDGPALEQPPKLSHRDSRPNMSRRTATDSTILPTSSSLWTKPQCQPEPPHRSSSNGIPQGFTHPHYPYASRHLFTIIERTLVSIFATLVAIYVPGFSSLMAFLGAFSAFLICIMGPIGAKVAIEGRCTATDAILFCIVFVMMVWGTLASFMVQEM